MSADSTPTSRGTHPSGGGKRFAEECACACGDPWYDDDGQPSAAPPAAALVFYWPEAERGDHAAG